MIDVNELKEKLKSVKLLSDEQVADIVETVLNRLAPERKADAEQRVYSDEPIDIQSRPERFERIERAEEAEQRIAAMRRIPFERGNRGKTPEEIFFLQAKFMEDYEDDYTPPFADHNDFRRQELGRYFSGFQSMSVKSLRIYYTWRTKLRGGEFLPSSLTNAFIYATELIHCIGCASKEDAYEALREFTERYSELDGRFLNFGKKWLKDFVIFYDLPAALIADRGGAADSVKVLGEPFSADDGVLYRAIAENASYKAQNSRFCSLHPNDFSSVVCRVYRALFAANRTETYRKYVGVFTENSYDLFGTAIFCARNCSADRIYRADAVTEYASRSGRWYVERLTRTTKQSQELGRLLKNIDHVMRLRWKFTTNIKPDALTEELCSLINEEISAFIAEKRIRKQQSIRLDLNKLDSIRNSADETAGLLLTDEDLFDESDEPETNGTESAVKSDLTAPLLDCNERRDDSLPVLTEAEKALLICLVSGEPYSEKLRELGTLPSIAADSLNDKLMDLFNDTVIVDSGSKLELIDDYIEDLKGISKQL